jgi:hypothetical protein
MIGLRSLIIAAVAGVLLLNLPVLSMAEGWVKDPKTGCSIWTNSADGASWKGACIGGKASGTGTLISNKGGKPLSTYKGTMKEGRISGQGEVTYATGDRYIGQFKDGKRNGRGIMFTGGGSSRYEGLWKNDEPVLTKPRSK